MATLEELSVTIKADASQLDRELKRVGGTVQQSTSRMTAAFGGLKQELLGLAPALGAAAFVAYAKQAVEVAGHMNDLSAQIGFAVDTISVLEKGLAATGTSLDQFAASINLMNANVGQAVSGNEELAQKFARLGLDVQQLKKLSPEDQFYAIADALAKVGTQYEQTEIGRSIFGRGFAALIPLIKESNGALGETVNTLKNLDEGVSADTLARIDAFGDALGAAGISARNSFLEAFGAILKVLDKVDEFVAQHDTLRQAGMFLVPGGGADLAEEQAASAYAAKAKSLGFVSEATKATIVGSQAYGPNRASPATSTASKQQTQDLRELSDATQAFLSRAEQAKKIYDDTRTPLEKYNTQLAEAKSLYEEGLLPLEAFTRYQEELADTLKRTGDQGIVTAKVIKDYLGDAFESAIFDAENFGDSVSSILNGIARQIARKGFIDPLSGGLSDIIDKQINGSGSGGGFVSSILSGLGLSGARAAGGSVGAGSSYLVGERGPEVFVPNVSGTIVPNAGTGGGLTVVNNWNVSPGVQGTVEAELRRAAPHIINQSVAATMTAIERGGRATHKAS